MPQIIVRDPLFIAGVPYAANATVDVAQSLGDALVGTGEAVWVVPPSRNLNPAGAAAVPDTASHTLTEADEGFTRAPSGTLTYAIDGATTWPVGGGALIYLPTSGTISFAVSGGATINGGTTTLTRTAASNASGPVALTRLQGANAYGLTGS